MGFDGIILGTIIVYIFINIWYEALIIFHHGFNKSVRKYIISTVFRLILIFSMMGLSLFITGFIPGKGLMNMLARGIVSLVLAAAVLLLIYHRNKYVTNSIRAIRIYIFNKTE